MGFLDQMPQELMDVILPYLDAMAFISLRRTSRQLKAVCDNAERSRKPALWYQYALKQHSPPGIESSEPLVRLWAVQTEAHWKQLFIRLWRISNIRLGYTVYQSRLHLHGFERNKIGFFGGELYMFGRPGFDKVHVLKNLPTLEEVKNHQDEFSVLSKQADIVSVGQADPNPAFPVVDDEKVEEYIRLYLQQRTPQIEMLYYSIDEITGEKVDFKHIVITRFPTQPNVFRYVVALPMEVRHKDDCANFCFNDNVLACTITNSQIGLFDLRRHKKTAWRTKRLDDGVRKMHLMGNLIIAMSSMGYIFTAVIMYDDNKHLMLVNIRKIYREGMSYSICDFDVRGNVFAAVNKDGEVFVSLVKKWTHASLERNFLRPYEVDTAHGGVKLFYISIDDRDGLRLMVSEQTFMEGLVHILFYCRQF